MRNSKVEMEDANFNPFLKALLMHASYPQLEHTLNPSNVFGTKQGQIWVKINDGSFGRVQGWFRTKVGLDLDKYGIG